MFVNIAVLTFTTCQEVSYDNLEKEFMANFDQLGTKALNSPILPEVRVLARK